ncbi:LPS export ABC transporter permease LptG [Betaproteobacteria bacterium SCN2]|jgi:lipopolysaccharide export system permease protein|nr:LPS export ABC transporter permease LptG [Betaproteobacteria bacterium SCN2]
MNLIARYLLREVATSAGFVFVALVLLFSFFDLASELDSIGRADYGFAQAALYVALNVPGHVYEIVPIAALIGALFALSRLVMNSEFTVMLASGISSWRVAMLLALAGVGFALIALLVGELVSPWSEQAAKRLKLQATESVVAQAFRSGLWVKDGNAFINAREVLPDSGLRGLKVYEFDQNWELERIVTAESGTWAGEKRWKLGDVVDTRFSTEGIKVGNEKTMDWESVLGPDILSVLLVSPEKMSTLALINYIRHLSENKQKTTRYEVALWSKFFYPLAIPVIMLLALPFAFHSPRSGGIALKVFLGILAGLAFHLSNRLFSHVGLLNDWPPFITASMPSLVFLAVALLVLKRLERR